MGLWWTDFRMDKVDFTVHQTTRGNQLYSSSHPSAQTPGLSNNIEVVGENIFRLLAFSLANPRIGTHTIKCAPLYIMVILLCHH